METRDLNLAAGLVASGFALLAVHGHETFAAFEFEQSDALRTAVESFHARQMSVDAASYGEAMRSLKAAAMSARRQAVAAGT